MPEYFMRLLIGCHVSAAGGVWNAPKNAADVGCEAFQIFTRPPMGGKAPEIGKEGARKFKEEMAKYGFKEFVVHCPYFVNFGSANKRIFHGSISVVREELERASLLGASYVMTHLGSTKELGQEKGLKQAREGLKKVLEKYKGSAEFLLEISAGAGEVIGDTFEELAYLMKPLVKMPGFGGICFDTQHAFAGGYDIRGQESVRQTFKNFDKIIGLKWLKMSHANDSKIELAGRKDRHEHIGEGKIGKKGFGALIKFLIANQFPKNAPFPLILETEHDKVKEDIKILKALRDKK